METWSRSNETGSAGRLARAPSNSLPLSARVLAVGPTEETLSSVRDALVGDGAVQVTWEQSPGAVAAVGRLRESTFDALLVVHEPVALPEAFDAMSLVEGLRSAGEDLPIVVVSVDRLHGLDALSYEAGADDCCSLADTSVRGLLWRLGQAIDARRTAREHRRFVEAERQRLLQEHADAQRLLDQQRLLLNELEDLRDARIDEDEEEGSPTKLNAPARPWPSLRSAGCIGDEVEVDAFDDEVELPAALADRYGELLRSYVILGTGGTSAELRVMAESLAQADVSARRTMQLHLASVESSLRGLGRRSTRHIIGRAELLAVELLSYLADCYREQGHARHHRRVQQCLPGFFTEADDVSVASERRVA